MLLPSISLAFGLIAFEALPVRASMNTIMLPGAEDSSSTQVSWTGSLDSQGLSSTINGTSIEQIFAYLDENHPDLPRESSQNVNRKYRTAVWVRFHLNPCLSCSLFQGRSHTW